MSTKSKILAAWGVLLLALGITGGATVAASATTAPAAAWTTPTTTPLDNGLSSMAYGNGHYVAISQYQDAMSSTDGITWTAATLQGNSFVNVTFGGGLFMAIGRMGTVATSADGTSWTVLSTVLPCSQAVVNGRCYSFDTSWQSVTYGAGTFVALQNGGSDAYSTDAGLTWQSGDLSGDYNWQSVTYGAGTFVAVAYNGPGPGVGVSYSRDGVTWTTQELNTGSFSNVVYGDGKFVAVERNAPYDSAVSTDGISWTISPQALPGSATDLAFGDGYFVAVGSFNTQVSTDGLTWSEMANSTTNRNVTFGRHQFIAGRGQDNITAISQLVLPDTTTSTVAPVVLSSTGSNSQALLELAGVILAVGAILLIIQRRQIHS